MLARAKPDESARLLELAQQDIDKRWRYYEELAGVDYSGARSERGANGGSDGHGESEAQTAKEVKA